MTLAPDPVLLEVSEQGVATVTLNRPESHNSFDELMIAGLAEQFETLKGADHVRVVFLRGAGESFCAGADKDWMRRRAGRTIEDNEADALALARMFKHLHDLPQLTVALVHGAAIGDGAGLVAACDVAVAQTHTSFCFPEVRQGLTAAIISPYVMEAIGVRRAKALFATAERFDALYAEKIGLVHTTVADDVGLQTMAGDLAALAQAAAPGAVAETKALARFVAAHKIDDALAKETARRFAQRLASPEGKAGLAALLEDRKPEWRT